MRSSTDAKAMFIEQGIIERMRIGGCSTNQWKQSMKALHEPMKKRADSGHKPLAYTTKSRIGITLARTRKRKVNGSSRGEETSVNTNARGVTRTSSAAMEVKRT
ncbi:hypothetical protein HanLR1_Chr04g0120961 [Helianthus annuus]|nr:hypothetical protein HanLR1_Chr04g0120961 [Helianthus annuus]